MQPHDYEFLNDFECWHVEHFADRLELWRRRNLGDASCFRLARADARRRFPLDTEEAARVDAYVASRFGVPKEAREPEGYPAPVMVAG